MRLSDRQRQYVLDWLQEQLDLVDEEITERKREGRQSAQQVADATWRKRFLESGLRKLTKEGTRCVGISEMWNCARKCPRTR